MKEIKRKREKQFVSNTRTDRIKCVEVDNSINHAMRDDGVLLGACICSTAKELGGVRDKV